MTQPHDDTPAMPALFAHTLRKEWGVGILSGESQGKRSYLFDNGTERTMARGFYDLMREVEQPNHEQQVIYARLRAVLAAREETKHPSSTKTSGPTFLAQLGRLHERYPAGFLDPKWAAEMRGDAGKASAPGGRDKAIESAQSLLSASALDALVNRQQFEAVWEQVTTVFAQGDLVPNAARPRGKPAAPHQRALAVAIRELLHGTTPYEPRFDKFVEALSAAFDKPPRWEAATALSALFHPKQQVGVELATFKKQLKTLSARASIGARPNSADYARLLGVAKVVANRLGEHGEMPRDLMDVYDFIRLTLKPASKDPAARAQARKRAVVETEPEERDAD